MNTRKIEQPALITQCNLARATEAKTNALPTWDHDFGSTATTFDEH